MHDNAVGRGVRRYDAAIGAGPARDQRVESRGDVRPPVDQRRHVVGDERAGLEHTREQRGAEARQSGTPRLKRTRPRTNRRERAVGADPHGELRGAGVARHRHDPRIAGTARAAEHALDAVFAAADERGEHRQRAPQQRLIADREAGDPLGDRGRGVGDEIGEPQTRRLAARPLGANPAERPRDVAQRRDAGRERKASEQPLDLVPVVGRERDVAVRVDRRERDGERAFAEVNREVRRAELRGKTRRRRPHEHQADAIGGEAELRGDERGLRPAARANVEAGSDAREEGDAARREVDLDGRDLELALDARTRLAE